MSALGPTGVSSFGDHSNCWPSLSGNTAASLFLNNTTIRTSDKRGSVDT